MSYRRFLVIVFIAFLFGFSVFPVINLCVDPSRVLTKDFEHSYGTQANHVFLKTAWAIDNPKKYHSFIFGSSRVDAGFASTDFPAGWFKISQPGGHPKEHAHNLKALLENNVNVKEVWLTLDDFDIYMKRDLVNDYKLKPYPINTEEKIDFLWFYLFRKPNKFEIEAFIGKHSLVKNPFIKGDIEKNGIPLHYDSYKEHDDMIKMLNAWSWDLSQKEKADIESTISYVAEIKKLCAEYGVKLEVLMTPRHYKVLYARDYINMAEFRRRLAMVTPYWDFSAITSGSSYWKDNHYWLETSHFSSAIGKMIIARINGDKSAPMYDKNFGVFVTQENVNDTVKKSYQALLSELPSMLAHDSNIRIDKSYLKKYKKVNITEMDNGYSFSKGQLRLKSDVTSDEGGLNNIILKVAFSTLEPITLQWQCDNKVLVETDVAVGEAVRDFSWEPACDKENRLVISKKKMLIQLSVTLFKVASLTMLQ